MPCEVIEGRRRRVEATVVSVSEGGLGIEAPLRVEQGDPVITQHLGEEYRSGSRFRDALVAYREALTLEPEEEDAEEIRRQIELLELQLGLRGKR